MENNKGITLVALAITILVLAILSVTVIFNGGNSIQLSKKQQFISELEMVQARVNIIYEKMQNSEEEKRLL